MSPLSDRMRRTDERTMAATHRMTIEWIVPLGQTRPINNALHSVAADVRPLPGCVGCSVSTAIGNRGVVRYVEEWSSEEDLKSRLRSRAFIQIVTLMEDATQPPHIEFELSRELRGFDYVEEVRGAEIHD